MNKKKAQSAMEFLMTYGWAILVVLAAIAALAYFGVLKPQGFLPDRCILVPGITCLDFKISTNESTFIISNSMGRDIEMTRITTGQCNQSFNQALNNGDKSQFILTGCSNGNSGDSFKEEMIIEYINVNSGFTKTIKGSISTKVQ